MALKNISKTNKIGINIGKIGYSYDRTHVVLMCLVNAIALKALNRPLSRRSKAFIEKVHVAFNECFEQKTPEYSSWIKISLVESLIEAYKIEDKLNRNKIIDRIIKRSGQALTSRQIKRLKDDPPKFIGKRKSAQNLALERIDSLMDYSARTYFRNRNRKEHFKNLMHRHYTEDIDPSLMLENVLGILFGLNESEAKEVSSIASKQNLLEKKWLPLTRGDGSWFYFKMMKSSEKYQT